MWAGNPLVTYPGYAPGRQYRSSARISKRFYTQAQIAFVVMCACSRRRVRGQCWLYIIVKLVILQYRGKLSLSCTYLEKLKISCWVGSYNYYAVSR